MNKLDKILYTAKAVSTGGREGVSRTDDGRLDIKLSTPKALGGNDGEGTNPEQLFAAGYSACFIGALKFAAMQEKVKLPDDLAVHAQVGIGPIATGFGINVKLNIQAPSLDQKILSKLVENAHQICQYSNATRGNIEVDLAVG